MTRTYKLSQPFVAAILAMVSAIACADGPLPAAGEDETSTNATSQELKKSHRKPVRFEMVRSAAAENAGCLPDAKARVRIEPGGPVEVMTVDVSGLPPNTEFDFFVIQVPNAPFGLAWYQGDIETDHKGEGHGRFIGRFSVETFIVATGTAAAPVVHDHPPFPDANSNPVTAPVHTFHLGLWFDSPTDAAAAHCASTVTPFNGDHTAGVQALSTRNFANDEGPLRQVQ